MAEDPSTILDRFYTERGPCCAGCDWWRYHNSIAGQCTRTAPVPGWQRIELLGITGSTLSPGAGHVFTPRDHHCGEFKDDFDWSTLPPHYLRRIGRAPAITRAAAAMAQREGVVG